MQLISILSLFYFTYSEKKMCSKSCIIAGEICRFLSCLSQWNGYNITAVLLCVNCLWPVVTMLCLVLPLPLKMQKPPIRCDKISSLLREECHRLSHCGCLCVLRKEKSWWVCFSIATCWQNSKIIEQRCFVSSKVQSLAVCCESGPIAILRLLENMEA